MRFLFLTGGGRGSILFVSGWLSAGYRSVELSFLRGSCGSYLGCFLGNLRLELFERVVGLLRLLLAILSAQRVPVHLGGARVVHVM